MSFDKLARRFVAILLNTGFLLKDMLTILRLGYRDASLIIL